MSKSRSVCLIALLPIVLSATSIRTRAQDSVPELTMEAYVQQVLERSPRLMSMATAIEAARHKVPQAGALPDPMVAASLMNVPIAGFRLDEQPMTMKQLTLTQGFPAPGVLGARTDVAKAGVEVAERNLTLTTEELIRWARLLYLDLSFLDRSLEIVSDNQRLLAQFVATAEARYRTGRGIQQDVLKAQLEHSRLTERLIVLEERRVGLVGGLNALRDLPPGTPMVVGDLPTPVDPGPPAPGLLVAALERNPELQRARAELERDRSALELARRLRLPSFSATAAYAQRDGGFKDLVTAMVGVQIPLYAGRKQNEAIEEQQARVRATEYRIRDREATIQADVTRLSAELERSQRLVNLYADEILPQAEGVLTSTLSGYRVDQVDFLTLLSAQTTLFNYQLAAVRVITDLHRARAELEAITGLRASSSGLIQ
jgi:outer membrane protein TolC